MSAGRIALQRQRARAEGGLFHLLTRGERRFRVLATRVARNQLVSADVELMPEDEDGAAMDAQCAGVLGTIIEKVGKDHFPAPLRLDDPAWVSYRLCEILPLEPPEKQALLEIPGTAERFGRLQQVLARLGLGTQE